MLLPMLRMNSGVMYLNVPGVRKPLPADGTMMKKLILKCGAKLHVTWVAGRGILRSSRTEVGNGHCIDGVCACSIRSWLLLIGRCC